MVGALSLLLFVLLIKAIMAMSLKFYRFVTQLIKQKSVTNLAGIHKVFRFSMANGGMTFQPAMPLKKQSDDSSAPQKIHVHMLAMAMEAIQEPPLDGSPKSLKLCIFNLFHVHVPCRVKCHQMNIHGKNRWSGNARMQ